MRRKSFLSIVNLLRDFSKGERSRALHAFIACCREFDSHQERNIKPVKTLIIFCQFEAFAAHYITMKPYNSQFLCYEKKNALNEFPAHQISFYGSFLHVKHVRIGK
jgi:hypothetical protein